MKKGSENGKGAKNGKKAGGEVNTNRGKVEESSDYFRDTEV